MKTLDQLFNPKSNSLGFIRFFAAVVVIFTHCFALGDFDLQSLAFINQLPGTIAVEIFFILSGFLITASYLRSTSIFRYAWHRFLRIYPGLWFCLIFTAFVIAPVVFFFANYGNFSDYFSSPDNNPFTYIQANLINPRQQIRIANLFETNPWSSDLNGSLWTLWFEIKYYMLVPLLGLCGLLTKRKRLFLGIFLVIFLIYILQLLVPATREFFFDIPYLSLYTENGMYTWKGKRLLLYFMAGSLLFLYRKRVNMDSKPLFMMAVLGTLLGFTILPHDLICIIVLPYLIFWLAIHLPFQNFEKNIQGDYSYGLYIYGYPVQQTLTCFGLHQYGFGIYFFLSIIGTLPLAIASWHYIEKPFCKFKKLSTYFSKTTI